MNFGYDLANDNGNIKQRLNATQNDDENVELQKMHMAQIKGTYKISYFKFTFIDFVCFRK